MKGIIFWGLIVVPSLVFGKPEGGRTVAGTVDVRQEGSCTKVKTSDRAIIQWDEFSIKKGEKTTFIQPNRDSAVLNRVNSGISRIDGILEANGRIYLVNPRGVVIGKEGVIDTGGFLASTLNLDDEDFFKNRALLFQGKSKGEVLNLGRITALGGDVFLLARSVRNEGTIHAGGTVGIGAGEEILLKPRGDQRLFVSLTKKEKSEGGIENVGLIEAANAELKADGNIFRLAINQKGIIDAKGIKEENGRVFLVAEGGSVVQEGLIRAEGGEVQLIGESVGIFEEGVIDTSSDEKGGMVLVGGDFQGKNMDVPNASTSVVMKGARIFADAKKKGDGGKIIIWSDESTWMQGSIFARGGEEGGNGGFIEISSLGQLCYCGFVNTTAPGGKGGNLLLDPSNVTIDSFAVNSNVSFNAVTGIYTPTGANAEISTVLDVDSLTNTLDTGTTNVTVITTSNFGGNGDIIVEDGATWASNNSLTLSADRDIVLNTGTFVNTGGASMTFQATRDFVMEDSFSNIQTNTGNINVNAEGNISIIPVNNAVTIESTDGNVVFNSGLDTTLGATTGVGGTLTVETVNGAVRFTTGRDLNFLGSDTVGVPVNVNIGRLPNTFTVGRNFNAFAGTNLSTSILIGGPGTRTADMTFSVGGNMTLLGGGGLDSLVQIGMQRGTAAAPITVIGNITLNIEGNLLMRAASAGAYTQIGHGNNNPGLGGFTGSGNVVVSVGGNVLVQAATDTSLIGHGNVTTPGADTYSGSILVNAEGIVDIIASNDAQAAIGFIAAGAGTTTINSNFVTVNAGHLTLNAAVGRDAYIGIHTSDNTIVDATIGVVSAVATGNIILNPGEVSAFTVDGSAAIGAFSENGFSEANVFVEGRDIFLNGSTGANGGLSRIITSSSGVFDFLQADIQARSLFVGTGSDMASRAEIFSSGSIQAISDFNTTLSFGTLIHTDLGSVTLVVDNKFPESPDIGEGQFIIESGALLSAGTNNSQALRIFTARRSQNSIGALLNGAVFVPGTVLVNSSTEQWATYFPSGFGGIPFTIFYKSGVEGTFLEEHGVALAEMFQNLKIYDELLFDCKYFLLGYDKDCYDQLLLPKGMLSSYDLFGDEMIKMLRQKYRNYHTKYVKSF